MSTNPRNMLLAAALAAAAAIGCKTSADTAEVRPPRAEPAPAASPTPEPAQTEDAMLSRFSDLVKKVDPKGEIIERAEVGPTSRHLTVTVANSWHREPYQIRLQAAQGLWKAWAAVNSPTEPDRSRLRLTDGNGNEVGGSRTWGGSMIWVAE